jgi:hypothetical protein
MWQQLLPLLRPLAALQHADVNELQTLLLIKALIGDLIAQNTLVPIFFTHCCQLASWFVY